MISGLELLPTMARTPTVDEQDPSSREELKPLLTSQHRLYISGNVAAGSSTRSQDPRDYDCTRGGRMKGDHENHRSWDEEKSIYELGAAHAGGLCSSSNSRHAVLPAIVMLLVLSASVVYVVMTFSILSVGSVPHASTLGLSTFNEGFELPANSHFWGAYTPYFTSEPYRRIPSGCSVNQVNIIQRHGARYPTSGASAGIRAAIHKLQSATEYKDPALNFLKNYTYTLGESDLVPFGASQSQESGKTSYQRYSKLVSRRNIPFIRSSGGTRVVDSATNWTQGFSIASDYKIIPPLAVILPENLNDTLDDSMCPNAGDSSSQTDTWTNIYGAPIAARLNSQALGANLTASDISSLIPLCAFETLATMSPSPFCALFTSSEFAQYEYYSDLDKYYKTGYGQALGPVQGVGYLNELLSRLTGLPVRDGTQTNRTLDSSPRTFPLDRNLYVDFSHDNQMIAIYAAMGLFKQAKPLDPMAPDPERTWITSHLVPFSGRMVTERLTCSNRRGLSKSQFVRILVNDAVQPLGFCGGDRNGLCELGAFVESQRYARHNGEGDFEKCFD